MGTVRVFNFARMAAIEAAAIVSGVVNGDNLILTKKDGSTVNAGNVRGPKGDQGNAGSALGAYPVGAIYLSVVSTNPATLFGGGTWVAWGAGRVPVGINTSDTDFDTVEETGGEKAVTLTHAQTQPHVHLQTTGYDGSTLFFRHTAAAILSRVTGSVSRSSVASTAATGSARQDSTDYGETTGTGTASAHNNIQPYIVCYMWKRTA